MALVRNLLCEAGMRSLPRLLASALVGGLLVLLPRAPAAADGGGTADRIVAVVDGEPITLAALRRHVAPLARRLERDQTPPADAEQRLHRGMVTALEEMIDETLIARAAAGAHVSDAEVDRKLDEAAAQSALSREAYLRRWAKEGWLEADMRELTRRSLLEWSALLPAYGKETGESRKPPPGKDDEASRQRRYDAWRQGWLAAQREKACIERRFAA